MTRRACAPWSRSTSRYRRGLGFALETPAWLLRDFARYADRCGHRGPADRSSSRSIGRCSSRSSDPAQPARRLAAVRAVRALPGAARSGDRGAAGGAARPGAAPPAAAHLQRRRAGRAARAGEPAVAPARAAPAHATSTLLLAAGRRPGCGSPRRCRLERGDVDLDRRRAHVREGKFRKSRLVPLHPSATRGARAATPLERDGRPARPGAFFRTERVPSSSPPAAVEKTFSRIRQRLGWTGEGRTRRPRIHDLRHRFAVRRLLAWYEEGADVERKLLALSTYLGHAQVTDTYWYLTGVPELMAIAAHRFERFAPAAGEGAAMRPPTSSASRRSLQEFFQRRLLAERGVSAHTIASYRDTFELLLRYAEQHTGDPRRR